MLLYDNAISGNCWKVRQLLAHLDLSYERREIDVVDRSDRPAAVRPLNPSDRIPVLVLDDGRALSESDAILLHLAEGTAYLPDDPAARTEVLRWMFFEQANHQPYLAMAWFLVRVMPGDPDPTVLGFLHMMGKLGLGAMERHLVSSEQPYFAGDAYTVADIALYPYARRAEQAGFELARYAALGEWFARVESQPGFVPAPTEAPA